jgi:hypothetical protein
MGELATITCLHKTSKKKESPCSGESYVYSKNLYSRTACVHHFQVLLLLELPQRTRSGSRAVIRVLRGIFFSHLGEIFDGHFETALWNFRDASIFR